MHEEVFAVRDPESALEIVGWRARASVPVQDGQGLELAPASEIDVETTRDMYVGGEGWCQVPVVGSARIAEVRGPAVLELPGTSIVLHRGRGGDAQCQRHDRDRALALPARRCGARRRRSSVPPESVTAFDPVDLAVLSSRFTAIVRSMSNTLIRTGRSVILNQGRDFSCCIVTAEDELFAMAESIPIHLLCGPDLMARSMKEFHPGLSAWRRVHPQLAVPRKLARRGHVDSRAGLRR